jgi:hypothetical protein
MTVPPWIWRVAELTLPRERRVPFTRYSDRVQRSMGIHREYGPYTVTASRTMVSCIVSGQRTSLRPITKSCVRLPIFHNTNVQGVL